MSKSNEAAIVHGPKDIRIESIDVQQIGENDILVAMDKIGICGTDLHIYLDGTIHGMGEPTQPWVTGHEGCGWVVEVGANVKHLKVGDKVVLDPNDYCRSCDCCITGHDNLCPNRKQSAWSHRGFFEKYHAHPARSAYKIPSSMSSDEAAMIEPVSCTVHGVQRAGIRHGHTVLICGAGPIGLLHLLVAKVYGASSIIITDIDHNRLKVAESLGATQTILIDPARPVMEAGQNIYDSVGRGVDIVLECSGVEQSIQLGIHAVKYGGKVVLVGLSATGQATLPVNVLSVKEVDIITCICYKTAGFREAIKLVESRQVDVRPLVSHTFGYKDIAKAFQALVDRSEPTVKILIDFGD